MRLIRKTALPSALWLGLLLAGLAGCATQEYKSDTPQNLTVRTEIKSSVFHNPGARLDILAYRAGQNCGGDYLGSLDLDEPVVQTGLRPGRKVVLRFELGLSASGNIFNPHTYSAVKWVGILTPRPGAQYVARIKYEGNMYEIRLLEVSSHGAVVREFARRQTACPAD